MRGGGVGAHRREDGDGHLPGRATRRGRGHTGVRELMQRGSTGWRRGKGADTTARLAEGRSRQDAGQGDGVSRVEEARAGYQPHLVPEVEGVARPGRAFEDADGVA
jgi:hypothetical protein